MNTRFLNNNDYISIVTEEALQQLIRGNEDRLAQAEEAAEASLIEYLTDNYEIEKEIEKGKGILPYNRNITYPAGSHFYYQGKIYEALRSIKSAKAPSSIQYWKEVVDYDENKFKEAHQYSQLKNYKPGDTVTWAGMVYECTEYNGLDFNLIEIPGIVAWGQIQAYEWQPNIQYLLWNVVEYEGDFYALIDSENLDLTVNPYDSSNWGQIGTYDPLYNEYEFKGTEYVVYNGAVYYPEMDPNADELKIGFNIRVHDPRNANVKKHILRLAVYELYKLISPNNVSSARISDYEASIAWLRDANRLRINPNIPRKLGEDNKPIAEFAIATFMRDYDPNKNPWQI